MSDMPTHRAPPPPDADHAQHDPLLVAQFAAGDELDDQQRLLAQQLMSSCRSCASLAADLGAVASAVAWEPVPQRRRDFRIEPEQAERMRGSALNRFLRRIPLPEVKLLRPAAVGVMSLGLLLMVAGNVWPDEGLVETGAEPAAAPAPSLAIEEPAGQGGASAADPDSTGVDFRTDAAEPTADVAERGAVASDPGADAPDPGADAPEPASDIVDAVTEDAEPAAPIVESADANVPEGLDLQEDAFADDVDESELKQEAAAKKAAKLAPSAARSALGAMEDPEAEEQAATFADRGDSQASESAVPPDGKRDEALREAESGAKAIEEAVPPEAELPADLEPGVAAEGIADGAEGLADADELIDSEADLGKDAVESALASPPVTAAVVPADGYYAADAAEQDGATASEHADAATVGGVRDLTTTEVEPTTAAADAGLSPETVLIAVGFVLAAAGAVLLLLAWLARRSRDPLLR